MAETYRIWHQLAGEIALELSSERAVISQAGRQIEALGYGHPRVWELLIVHKRMGDSEASILLAEAQEEKRQAQWRRWQRSRRERRRLEMVG